jgi:tetratricopeptide (TPR) repeat protein
MNRSDLIKLTQAASAAGQAAYARQAAQTYLAEWPEDLAVKLALARALAAMAQPRAAADILEAIVAADPEDWAAQRCLAVQLAALGEAEDATRAYASAYVGDGRKPDGPLPGWALAARAGHQALRIGNIEAALGHSQAALKGDPASPLPALLHLASLWHGRQLGMARTFAEAYLGRWPHIVALKLCLAECLLAGGDHSRAIEWLHEAAAQDMGGQVATRYWGAQHPYRSLWPAATAGTLPGPLPAALVQLLGINRLTAGATSSQAKTPKTNGEDSPPLPESLADIQEQLDRVASRLPHREALKYRIKKLKLASVAAESPSTAATAYYIALSSKTRLLQAFGPDGLAAIEIALHTLLGNTRKHTGLRTSIVYVDDPATLSPFGLRPVNPTSAWDVKALIAKLATRLKELNTAIGAVLIIGGDEIIPFHRLPNPTDDADVDIPSDNPYATSDENYFVPEWPVGRLPSSAGQDAGPLVHIIRQAAGAALPAGAQGRPTWLQRLRYWLLRQWHSGISRYSFGYSANVWRQASAVVYNLIGDPKELLTSPPLDANALPIEGLAPSRLSYFNLHGIEDGPEWFGQRSYDDPGSVPEYPVALRPSDVTNSGRAPVIVFSEACYGANIAGKNVEDALCLKFLASGTRVMVGSTKIAYGSVTTPLIGADLLGHCFWQNLTLGLPAGDALRRARLQMAHEMHRRQGFLDGEDQKTLISFVLYGDPLATAPTAPVAARAAARLTAKPLPIARSTNPPDTVCDKSLPAGRAVPHQPDLTPEVTAQIKSLVSRYLPGMQDAAMHITHARHGCRGGDHACPTAQLGKQARSSARRASGTTVVTLSKTVRASAHSHPHYARVTLDEQGKVIKLAVSR